MRALIIKTSSMGDVIHTLPALTDAGSALSDVRFDWVVEENFAEIPRWHPLVENVIPVALRRWRKAIFSAQTRAEWREFRGQLSAKKYDIIIDAQGLWKSALLARLAKGPRAGFDWPSARDSFASLLYQYKYTAGWDLHAITRLRSLFSQVFHYALPSSVADYGIERRRFITVPSAQKYLVFLHGTTWPTKHWPEAYWIKSVSYTHLTLPTNREV